MPSLAMAGTFGKIKRLLSTGNLREETVVASPSPMNVGLGDALQIPPAAMLREDPAIALYFDKLNQLDTKPRRRPMQEGVRVPKLRIAGHDRCILQLEEFIRCGHRTATHHKRCVAPAPCTPLYGGDEKVVHKLGKCPVCKEISQGVKNALSEGITGKDEAERLLRSRKTLPNLRNIFGDASEQLHTSSEAGFSVPSLGKSSYGPSQDVGGAGPSDFVGSIAKPLHYESDDDFGENINFVSPADLDDIPRTLATYNISLGENSRSLLRKDLARNYKSAQFGGHDDYTESGQHLALGEDYNDEEILAAQQYHKFRTLEASMGYLNKSVSSLQFKPTLSPVRQEDSPEKNFEGQPQYRDELQFDTPEKLSVAERSIPQPTRSVPVPPPLLKYRKHLLITAVNPASRVGEDDEAPPIPPRSLSRSTRHLSVLSQSSEFFHGEVSRTSGELTTPIPLRSPSRSATTLAEIYRLSHAVHVAPTLLPPPVPHASKPQLSTTSLQNMLLTHEIRRQPRSVDGSIFSPAQGLTTNASTDALVYNAPPPRFFEEAESEDEREVDSPTLNHEASRHQRRQMPRVRLRAPRTAPAVINEVTEAEDIVGAHTHRSNSVSPSLQHSDSEDSDHGDPFRYSNYESPSRRTVNTEDEKVDDNKAEVSDGEGVKGEVENNVDTDEITLGATDADSSSLLAANPTKPSKADKLAAYMSTMLLTPTIQTSFESLRTHRNWRLHHHFETQCSAIFEELELAIHAKDVEGIAKVKKLFWDNVEKYKEAEQVNAQGVEVKLIKEVESRVQGLIDALN